MKDAGDNSLTIRVGEVIPKSLHSRDSAERLARCAMTLWRERPDKLRKTAKDLILDFAEVEHISESAAEALIEFRHEFAEDKHPEIKFSNLSASAAKTIAVAERHLRQALKARKGRAHNFVIKV